MILIKPDMNRRIAIPGVPGPVLRPVDIDQARTGFSSLRTLRIYSFDKGSVIEGHAEEDEVLIVMMGGSIALLMMTPDSGDPPHSLTLTAASDSPGGPCAAYLPPHACYRLTAESNAEVAYVRATPSGGPPPHVFRSHSVPDHRGVTILLEEKNYARQLRLRLVQVKTGQEDMSVMPMQEREHTYEALIHVRTTPSEGVANLARQHAPLTPLASWDTIAVAPGDSPAISFKAKSSALVLIVFATEPPHRSDDDLVAHSSEA
jgi:hypothetical protein